MGSRTIYSILEAAAQTYGNAPALHQPIGHGKYRTYSWVDYRQAVVEIDDEGPGIAAEQMELVFRPYYRLEGSRSRETGGVGLGLSIARAVIRAEGGEIALSNRPEGGLRARVTLPLGTAPAGPST